MFVPMLFVASILIATFYLLDTVMLRREPDAPRATGSKASIGNAGKVNIILLAGIIGAVLLSGVWRPGISFTVHHVEVEFQNLIRDLLLLVITFISWSITPGSTRVGNEFSWFPILEVAKLFAGIFVTIVPAIAILRAGHSGFLTFVRDLVTSEAQQPMNAMYFWMTGTLSSFLDNAPNYLVFFNTAGGDRVFPWERCKHPRSRFRQVRWSWVPTPISVMRPISWCTPSLKNQA